MERVENSIKALEEVQERLYSIMTIKNLLIEGKIRQDHYDEIVNIERYMIKRDMDRLRIKVQQLTDSMEE